jgi:hypothetical protein
MMELSAGGVSTRKSLGVWVLEILSEAVGTTLWFWVLAFVEVIRQPTRRTTTRRFDNSSV